MNGEKYSKEECHKVNTVELFNHTWDLIGKKERTREEIDEMIHSAHTSCYNWSKIGTPLNVVRGEWQISRVYLILEMYDSALYHAKRCLNICQENNIGDFAMAFAYEAIARAYSIKGEKKEKEEYLKRAEQAGMEIKNKEDREYFFPELSTIKDDNG